MLRFGVLEVAVAVVAVVVVVAVRKKVFTYVKRSFFVKKKELARKLELLLVFRRL